jgi:hypothetical protein
LTIGLAHRGAYFFFRLGLGHLLESALDAHSKLVTLLPRQSRLGAC